MKRLVAVLLVLVGTTAMSFACVTKCRSCGNEREQDCRRQGHRTYYIETCDECPTCDRCWKKGHTRYDCKVSRNTSGIGGRVKNYDEGYKAGISGKENNCKPNSYLDNCNTGYRNGLSDRNAAERGEFTSEE